MFFSEIPGRTIYTRKLDHNNPITPSAQNNKISQQFEDFFDPNYPILQRKGARMMTLIKREKVYCHEKLDSEGDSGEIGKVPCQLNNEDRILSVDWIWNVSILVLFVNFQLNFFFEF